MCVQKNLRKHISEQLDDHPFEIGLSLALVIFGFRSVFSGLQSVPSSVEALPIALVVSYCVLSTIGGGSVLFGLFARYKFAWAYGAERAGLFISAAAWASDIVGLAFSPITPNSTLFMLALGALGYASLRRANTVKKRVEALKLGLSRTNANRESE